MLRNGFAFASLLLAAAAALAQAPTIVGIVEGSATLIRQTTRYQLAEGVALNEQDIVETAPGGFVQIELPDGVLLGVGESSKLMLRPKSGTKGVAVPSLLLLEGWLKTTANADYNYSSLSYDLATQGATTVAYTNTERTEVFVESGRAKLTLRDASRASTAISAGDFALRRENNAPVLSKRASPEFLQRLPRMFRDKLPPRAALLAKRSVAPKALAEISYPDAEPYLRLEPALRLPLLPLWKSRAVNDKAFRAAAKEKLALHPEWEPFADPEGYARRLAAEAERRRQREAAREAARAASALQPTN